MVLIAHLADSHLGFRLRKGRINQWKEVNKITWYEDKIYQRWDAILNAIIERKHEVTCVIHAGDLYNAPYKGYSRPPLETARTILMRSLRKFFEQTNNKIPFLIIDGNHGIYTQYNYSPVDPVQEVFPNLHFFSTEDLREAIRGKKRLSFKIEEKKLAFHLFPYFEFSAIQEFERAYKDWIIKIQTPEPNYINVAVVHGMRADKTLHPNLLEQKFDYIALGHNHIQDKTGNNIYDSGSIYPLTFGEKTTEWGFAFVELHPNTTPKITPITWEADCKLVEIQIDVSLQKAPTEILKEVKEKLVPFKKQWNGKTASRVKLRFKGTIRLENYWQIQDELEYFRREINGKLNYNLLQFIWDWVDTKTELGKDIVPGTIIEYILENPKKEFIEFVREKVDRKAVDLDLLSELAIESIEKALKEIEQ